MTKILSILFLPILFCCFFFGYTAYAVSSQIVSPENPIRIKVSSFLDNSGYDGPWNLGSGIGNMFRESLSKINRYQIVPSSISSSGDGSVLFVLGTIEEFKFQSEGLTSDGVGGYERFASIVELKLKIQSSTGSIVVGPVKGMGKTMRNNLGLSLLGGPAGYRYTKRDIDRLWTIPFDSDELRDSIIGESIQEAIDDIIVQISLGVTNTPLGLKGSILKIRGQKVHINIGTKNKVLPGQVFVVYARRERIINPSTGRILGYTSSDIVGKVKIVEVPGKDLSIAEIIEGKENIKERDIAVFR